MSKRHTTPSKATGLRMAVGGKSDGTRPTWHFHIFSDRREFLALRFLGRGSFPSNNQILRCYILLFSSHPVAKFCGCGSYPETRTLGIFVLPLLHVGGTAGMSWSSWYTDVADPDLLIRQQVADSLCVIYISFPGSNQGWWTTRLGNNDILKNLTCTISLQLPSWRFT